MKKFLNGPWVLLLPTVIVLACVVFLPLLISLWTSFTPFKLTRPDTLYKFVGFRNYERLFGNYGYPIGNLKGKKAVVFCTYGSPQFAIRTFFLNMPTKRLKRGVFNLCGIRDIVYKRFFSVPFVSDEKRKKFLNEVVDTADKI